MVKRSHHRCSTKNMFLEISQNSQENTCATLFKKRLWRRCFPVNFAKFLRTPFLQNSSGRLLLNRTYSFFIVFFCVCFFFSFVITFTDWFLLAKNYFNTTTLRKVINNQIKQNFPRFPSFRSWV